MLYTVNNSSITSNSFDSLIRIIPEGAPILFYEDGVYNSVKGARDEQKISDAATTQPIYALQADLEARGLDNLVSEIKVIDYDGFVALVEEHDVVPWL